MKIQRVKIENYRSIKQLELSPREYSVLIGENNAGKSNILKAINLVLGGTYPSSRSFSEEDFYNQDTSNEIVIQIYFDEEQTEWKNNCPVKYYGFELRCKAYKRRVGNAPAGSLTTEFIVIDSKGQAAKYPSEPLKEGKKPAGHWIPLPVSNSMKDKIPFIYIDVLRDYGSQEPNNRWSVLRKLLDGVNNSFLNDKEKIAVLDANGKLIKVTRKEAFEMKIKEAYEILKTDEYLRIEERIRDNALEQMGFANQDGDINLYFESYDPINVYKNLQLYVKQLEITSQANSVGAGLQSAIVIAIFRAYEELKKEGAIFAIEEPEVFLHPQKARFFSEILSSLTLKGNQVFVTTHSPIFVQMDKHESLLNVRRTHEQGTFVKSISLDLTDDEKRLLKMVAIVDAQRSEMFFAKGIIFVEGATEKIIFPCVFRKLRLDMNQKGISIIECNGKDNILLFTKLADSLELPYVAIADEDIMENSGNSSKITESNKMHSEKNSLLNQNIKSEDLFWMKPNIESELSLPKNDKNKLLNAANYMKNLISVPNCLYDPIKRLFEKLGIIQNGDENNG